MIVLQKLAEGCVAERGRETSPECLSGARIVAQSQVASNDMFEKAHCASLLDTRDHIRQYGTHCIKAFIRLADVGQSDVIQKDLLDDEDSNRLAELGASLHDTQAERDDLCAEKECDDLRVVGLLDQRANDA